MKTYRLVIYNNSRGKQWFRAMIVVGLIMVMALANLFQPIPVVYASPDTIIDTFDLSQTVTQVGLGFNSGTAGDTESTILGGERDVVATVTAVGSGSILKVEANGGSLGRLAHSQDADVKGTSLMTYDGNDDDATTLSFGLGSVDLSSDDAFIIELISADLNVTAKITYYTTNGSTCSSMSMVLPAMASSDLQRAVVFPFGGFSQDAGCTSAASISDVDAIQLFIDGTANASADVTLDLFKTASLDYGDLPEGDCGGTCLGYNITTLANNGAGHVVGSLYMGSTIDAEADGQPDPTVYQANEDDATNNDEDGVVRTTGVKWSVGSGGSVDVTVTGGNGCLSGWIDWSNPFSAQHDGDFNDAGELIINNVAVIPGTNTYTFAIPGTVSFPRGFYARFRLFPRDLDGTCTSSKTYTGQSTGGEVEDYWWDFGPNAVVLNGLQARSGGYGGMVAVLVALGLVGVGGIGFFAVRRRRA